MQDSVIWSYSLNSLKDPAAEVLNITTGQRTMSGQDGQLSA